MNKQSKLMQQFSLWVIWTALFTSLFFYDLFLSSGDEGGSLSAMDGFALVMLLVPMSIAVGIRWFIVPRLVDQPAKILPPYVVGLAMAEALTFYGLFVFQESYYIFFAMSIIGVLQFIPIKLHKGICFGGKANNPFQE